MGSISRLIKLSQKKEARYISSFFSEEKTRKKIYAQTLCKHFLKELLIEQDFSIEDDIAYSTNTNISEYFDIADIAITNNIRLDCRCIIDDNYEEMWIPIKPLDFGFSFDIYVAMKIHTDSNKIELIGFIENDTIKRTKDPSNTNPNYYIVNSRFIKPINELKDTIHNIEKNTERDLQKPLQDHTLIESLMQSYIEGNLSAREKIFVKKHISTCEECRENLVALYIFDNKARLLNTIADFLTEEVTITAIEADTPDIPCEDLAEKSEDKHYLEPNNTLREETEFQELEIFEEESQLLGDENIIDTEIEDIILESQEFVDIQAESKEPKTSSQNQFEIFTIQDKETEISPPDKPEVFAKKDKEQEGTESKEFQTINYSDDTALKNNGSKISTDTLQKIQEKILEEKTITKSTEINLQQDEPTEYKPIEEPDELSIDDLLKRSNNVIEMKEKKTSGKKNHTPLLLVAATVTILGCLTIPLIIWIAGGGADNIIASIIGSKTEDNKYIASTPKQIESPKKSQQKDEDLGRIQNEGQIEESNSTSDTEDETNLISPLEKPSEGVEEGNEDSVILAKAKQKERKPEAAKSKSEPTKLKPEQSKLEKKVTVKPQPKRVKPTVKKEESKLIATSTKDPFKPFTMDQRSRTKDSKQHIKSDSFLSLEKNDPAPRHSGVAKKSNESNDLLASIANLSEKKESLKIDLNSTLKEDSNTISTANLYWKKSSKNNINNELESYINRIVNNSKHRLNQDLKKNNISMTNKKSVIKAKINKSQKTFTPVISVSSGSYIVDNIILNAISKSSSQYTIPQDNKTDKDTEILIHIEL